MDPDDFQQAWRAQPPEKRLEADAESLLDEVRRKQAEFAAVILWRDVREIGVSLLMIPLWIYLGLTGSLPWTWYLTIPALLWIAGYMLADRKRRNRRTPEPGEPLRQCAEGSLAQVEQQIRLLRNVHWWYLLPLALPMLAFFGQVAWRTRSGGWWTVLTLFVVVGFVAMVFTGIYWLNLVAVRSDLEPRRRELEALLASLGDETPEASG